MHKNGNGISTYTEFIWKIADLLRGDYKQSEYGDVILPFTVLTRLDSILEETKQKVLDKSEELDQQGFENKEPFLRNITGYRFYNTSDFTLQKLKDDAPNLADNLRDYITSFSPNVVEILESFDISIQIER